MKKTIAFLLSLAVLLMSFAACGKTDTTETAAETERAETAEINGEISAPAQGQAPDGEKPGEVRVN